MEDLLEFKGFGERVCISCFGWLKSETLYNVVSELLLF